MTSAYIRYTGSIRSYRDGENERHVEKPQAVRKVYRGYDKESYRDEIQNVVKNHISNDKDTNAKQRLIQKRHQEVAEDQFKTGDRKINLKKETSLQEAGNSLLYDNVERERMEREARKKEYAIELRKQVGFFNNSWQRKTRPLQSRKLQGLRTRPTRT